MAPQDKVFMDKVMKQADTVESCVTGSRNGSWSLVRRDAASHPKYPPEYRIGLNADGTKLALSTDKGTQVYTFPKLVK
jgi:hypothetical protein